MTSLKKSAANRENAKRSTGPTTEIGKLRASGNSTKHSLFARKLFLDDEERERFEEFRGAIYQQRTGAGVLAQVDEFFAAQRASGLDCAAEPEDEELIFPEETSTCG